MDILIIFRYKISVLDLSKLFGNWLEAVWLLFLALNGPMLCIFLARRWVSEIKNTIVTNVCPSGALFSTISGIKKPVSGYLLV